MSGRILIVDDDPAITNLLVAGLSASGFEPTGCGRAHQALRLMEERDFDVVVSDLMMPGMDGIQLCERISQSRPDVPVLLITAFASLDRAIAAIRAGAYDFITKPVQVPVAAMRIRHALQHRELREEVRRLQSATTAPSGMGAVVGESPEMRRVLDLVSRLDSSEATVLLVGESGTGKEMVARLLHQRSRRRDGPFIAVNCAALPENLLEDELFGHVKGAFTDAKTERVGLLREANGGTFLLDEIGDMPLALQPKLLRALEEKQVRPLGGNSAIPFDVRIIAATHHDLEEQVARGRFREDLYYRINVVRIDLPPLSSRGNDVLLLAQSFVRLYADKAGKDVKGISAPAAARLLNYRWPGNVRELKNCIERAIALARFDQITVDDLPEKIRNYRATPTRLADIDPAELLSLEEVEKRYIAGVLKALNGNKKRAAEVLGLDRRTLYRKLGKYAAGAGLGGPEDEAEAS